MIFTSPKLHNVICYKRLTHKFFVPGQRDNGSSRPVPVCLFTYIPTTTTSSQVSFLRSFLRSLVIELKQTILKSNRTKAVKYFLTKIPPLTSKTLITYYHNGLLQLLGSMPLQHILVQTTWNPALQINPHKQYTGQS